MHTGAVEAERVETSLPLQPLITTRELALRESECMTEMHEAVHVWVRTCAHKLPTTRKENIFLFCKQTKIKSILGSIPTSYKLFAVAHSSS